MRCPNCGHGLEVVTSEDEAELELPFVPVVRLFPVVTTTTEVLPLEYTTIGRPEPVRQLKEAA